MNEYKTLEAYYIEARYPPDTRVYSHHEGEKAYRLAKEIIRFIMKRVKIPSSSGFAPITILIALTILILAGGGVAVWQRKVSPIPMPTPTLIVTPKLRLSPTPSLEAELPPEAKVCQKDDDCLLGVRIVCLRVCDPCITGDANDSVWEALNKTWCQNTWKALFNKVKKENYACTACISGYTNKYNLRAKCINNVCTKTR